mgnify:FL=1
MKKFMTKLLTTIVISTITTGTSVYAENLYINGKMVDQKIIDQTINQFKKSSPMAASQIDNPKFKLQILQSIGMQQAILLEGDSQSLDKKPEYLEKIKDIKPMIYAQILQDKATLNAVTESDIKSKYDLMKKLAMQQKQYKTSHILVNDIKIANNIIAELSKGVKFADLAKKYSIDTGSKIKGGDLGWSDGSNYVPEFTEAIKSLEKGKYTQTPVKSQFGYHVIKLEDTKTGDLNNFPSYDKSKDQIKQELQMEKVKQLFESLKVKYKVEVK